MAIEYRYENKCGEATMIQSFNGEDKTCTLSLYEGNCYMIMVREHTNEEGNRADELVAFFFDDAHLRRCLENGMFSGWDRLAAVKINKAKSRHWRNFVTTLAEFLNFSVAFYTEGKLLPNLNPKISDERIREIAQKAIDFIDMNDQLYEFYEESDIDLSYEEKESFNIISDDDFFEEKGD